MFRQTSDDLSVEHLRTGHVDPNQPHAFMESHLNTACGLCARRRFALLHTERRSRVSFRRILADQIAQAEAEERERREFDDFRG